MSVNEVEQTIDISGWINFTWFDQLRVWNSSAQFADIEILHMGNFTAYCRTGFFRTRYIFAFFAIGKKIAKIKRRENVLLLMTKSK